MPPKSLYRLYRPLTFNDVVGQQALLTALTQAVKSKQLAHAYLFCGTRGTGKTSLARILARAVNCLNEKDGNPCNQCSNCQGILNHALLDVLEIDAASNNSVDHIRKLTEEVVFTPTVCKYKVYIIDEVHMLSTGAFNALLKTLEEPPAHVIFILATTEPHKIPQTILSRCQRYDLKSYTIEELYSRLKKIANEQNILADESALLTLAKLGEGSFRDAISLLDQCRNQFNGLFSRNDVLKMAGLSSDEELFELLHALSSNQFVLALESLQKLLEKGLSPIRLSHDLAWFFRDVLIYDFHKGRSELLPYMDDRLEKLKHFHQCLSLENTKRILVDLSKLLEDLKKSVDARIHLELFIIKLMDTYFVAKTETPGLQDSKPQASEPQPTKIQPKEPEQTVALKEEPAQTELTTVPPQKPSENLSLHIPHLMTLWQQSLSYIEKKNAQLAQILSSLNISLENNTFFLHVEEDDNEAREMLTPKILNQLLRLMVHYEPSAQNQLHVQIKWIKKAQSLSQEEDNSPNEQRLAWENLLEIPVEEQSSPTLSKDPIQEICESLSIPYEEQ